MIGTGLGMTRWGDYLVDGLGEVLTGVPLRIRRF